MADLMLDEYRGISKERLSQILKEEARKIYGSGSFENQSGETFDDLQNLHFIFRYWAKFTTFISSIYAT